MTAADSNKLGHWMSLPITATFWSYIFGAVCTGLTSLYYLQRPEKYSLSSKVHNMCINYKHVHIYAAHAHIGMTHM